MKSILTVLIVSMSGAAQAGGALSELKGSVAADLVEVAAPVGVSGGDKGASSVVSSITREQLLGAWIAKTETTKRKDGGETTVALDSTMVFTADGRYLSMAGGGDWTNLLGGIWELENSRLTMYPHVGHTTLRIAGDRLYMSYVPPVGDTSSIVWCYERKP